MTKNHPVSFNQLRSFLPNSQNIVKIGLDLGACSIFSQKLILSVSLGKIKAPDFTTITSNTIPIL